MRNDLRSRPPFLAVTLECVAREKQGASEPVGFVLVVRGNRQNTRIFMLEPKASNQMNAPDVIAKLKVAVEWCRRATEHAASYEGKPWVYVLIPHDAIAENMTIEGLARQFAVEADIRVE